MFSLQRRKGGIPTAPPPSSGGGCVGFRGAVGALLAVVLLPGLAPAQNGAVVLRNDTPITVVVSVSSVVGGRILRARPQFLKPKLSLPFVLPGNKAVTLYDSRFPTRALYTGIIPASPLDLAFSIQPGLPPLLRLVPLQ